MFVFEAEDLDSETRMLMDAQSMFMDVSLRLNRVEISNLDKFTAVDLLVVLRNLLGSNEAMSTYEQTSHAGLGVGVELTMAMQPPSGDVRCFFFISVTHIYVYYTRRKFVHSNTTNNNTRIQQVQAVTFSCGVDGVAYVSIFS